MRGLMVSRGSLQEKLATHLRYEQAMAGCSRALLLEPNETALDIALSELLTATDADYVYIDENYQHPEVGLSCRITHEAAASHTKSSEAAWIDGPYSDCPTAFEGLSRGEAVAILVADLVGVEREQYEREGMLSELCLPIHVGGVWVGSIGFCDYLVERRWTEDEIRILRMAAEMIGAFWQRRRDLERLESLIRSKDEFLATVSHELRTPLTAVLGFTGLLLDHDHDHDPQEMLSLAHRSATEAAWIIEDLLVHARGDLGTLAFITRRVDLAAEVHEVVATSWVESEKELTVTGRRVMAAADPGRVRQVVRNLVQNALRYGGPHILISTRTERGLAIVEVVEDGPGVPDGQTEQVFEPFWTSPGDSAVPGAFGLGLSVCRLLAGRMGGSLVYERENGLTRFRLSLPTWE